MLKDLTEKAVAFHGHSCPGLAIGIRASADAITRMGLRFSEDENLACVIENDACGVDAVSALLGCSIGKGNLIMRGTGKMAFTFFKGEEPGLRYLFTAEAGELSRESWQKCIMSAPIESLYKIAPATFPRPERARHFKTVICSVCGEGAPEHKIRMQDGALVCLDCFREYDRGF